jgi:DNA-nicking Smr family endonuclease
LPQLDRRKARRIATGATEIEGRLDLHGMTQSAAHDRLIAFILHSAGLGRRTVLVITGKGGSRGGASDDGDDVHGDGLGILRRNMPRWLAERPLRDVVLGCQQAAPRHGGDGAFYVTLRSKRKLHSGP